MFEDITMAIRKCILLLCLTIMMSFAFGCAATATSEGTAGYFDDTGLTTAVKAAILQEKTLSSAEINVETFKSVVQLSGFVSSREQINTAVEVASQVHGVKSVRNDMHVKGQQ
jgi:osmotically-inducible protein OsmY